jgi:hypothetical protein
MLYRVRSRLRSPTRHREMEVAGKLHRPGSVW